MLPRPGEVHVWCSSVFHSSDVLCSVPLMEAEKTRISAIVDPIERKTRALSCSLVRTAVASYLGRSLSEVELFRNELGKPFIKHNYGLRMSISHTKEVVVVAFSFVDEIGVDIEKQDFSVSTIEDIARVAFSENEKRELAKIPFCERQKRGISIWTRKEAILKATGLGLSIHPSTLDVCPRSSTRNLYEVLDIEFHNCKFSCVDIELGYPWICSIALLGQLNSIRPISMGWPNVLPEVINLAAS